MDVPGIIKCRCPARFKDSCLHVFLTSSFAAAEGACREAGSALLGAQGIKTQLAGLFLCKAPFQIALECSSLQWAEKSACPPKMHPVRPAPAFS